MKSGSCYQNQYYCNSRLKDFFKVYKVPIILFTAIFLFGLLLGIFLCAGKTGDLELEDFFNDTFINYLCGEASNWSVFFNQVLYISIFSLIAIIFNNNIFFVIVNISLVAIRGYVLGFDIVCIVTLFPVLGLVLSLIIYAIFLLIANLIYALICAIAFKKYRIFKKYGCVCSKEKSKAITKCMILLLLLIILILLIQCLLLIIIKATIVF